MSRLEEKVVPLSFHRLHHTSAVGTTNKNHLPYKTFRLSIRILLTIYNLIMGRIYLGEFEEIVLLVVGVLYEDAYAVAIAKEIAKQTHRVPDVAAVHKALYRLEDKGMLKSRFGESEAKRGGKRKRLFFITPYGKKALDECMEVRMNLRSQIQQFAFKIQGT
jgi:DNA-binding PadR family transcriptional regulator